MKIPSWIKAVAGFIAAVIAAIGAFWFTRKETDAAIAGEKTAVKKKEETYEKIKNTPASDLVSGADNAADLHADASRIGNEAKGRLRDRGGKIIQRYLGSGSANRADERGRK